MAQAAEKDARHLRDFSVADVSELDAQCRHGHVDAYRAKVENLPLLGLGKPSVYIALAIYRRRKEQ